MVADDAWFALEGLTAARQVWRASVAPRCPESEP